MTDSRTSSGCLSSFIRSTLLSFWFFLRVSIRHSLSIDPVQPALGLLHARPAPGTRVLVGRHRPGLGFAPYALVTLLEKRAYGNVVLLHVLPDLLVTPARERRYLRSLISILPEDYLRIRPLGCLLPPDAGHPRIVSFEGPLQGLYLTYLAAEVWRARPHPLAVPLDLLLDGESRSQDL